MVAPLLAFTEICGTSKNYYKDTLENVYIGAIALDTILTISFFVAGILGAMGGNLSSSASYCLLVSGAIVLSYIAWYSCLNRQNTDEQFSESESFSD
jgi:hypothetical protein